MKLYEYFLLLRRKFPKVQENEEVNVTLSDLSQILDCSPRNAKLLILKMIDKNWLFFKSGKGRGNLSSKHGDGSYASFGARGRFSCVIHRFRENHPVHHTSPDSPTQNQIFLDSRYTKIFVLLWI